ncbi:hypothetical protein [Acidiferrobacter sp.]|uniref:hypothetical protein n=1 Tax=Acidiferrobacter sp. TaxID=1872107 RepID=UPI0026278E9D|nr:hypothetical protein [Acidiferrobacter sp.]
MRYLRAAVCAVLLAASPLVSCRADAFIVPPPGPGAPPPPAGGPYYNGPVQPLPPPGPARMRLRQLVREERYLRGRMWQLRMRRRQFLAAGMPYRAHRVHERLIALGWRLRRIQAQERILLTH